jgi:hypothetical protein
VTRDGDLDNNSLTPGRPTPAIPKTGRRPKQSGLYELAGSAQGFLHGRVEVVVHDNGIKCIGFFHFSIGSLESSRERPIILRSAPLKATLEFFFRWRGDENDESIRLKEVFDV